MVSIINSDTSEQTLFERRCVKNATKYAGKCFDQISKEDQKHSRTCFCNTDRCNENSTTLLFGEEPEIIYNISSSTA